MTMDGGNAAFERQLRHALLTLRTGSGPGHPSEDDWSRFAAKEMSSSERALIADHIVACEECAAIFRVVSLIDVDAPAMATGADRRSAAFSWRTLAAAAAVVLTAGLGIWWAMRSGADDNGQRAAIQPATPSGTPAVPASAPHTPLWAALPTPPEVRLPADLVLTMRGADVDRDAFLKVFGEAIAPYRAQRFAEAAAALTPVAERYSDVVEVWFYLGTSRLLSGAASAAVAPLVRARSSTVVGDDARWLHAVALQRAGKDREALAALQALCSKAGPYRQRACAVITP